MNIVAKPYPVGAQPFAVVMPMRCQYPWCTHKELTTDGSEMAVHARITIGPGRDLTGNMHVSHTPLFDRYGDRMPEFYDDGSDPYGSSDEAQPQPYGMGARTRRAGEKLLGEIIATMPTSMDYVSNVEDVIKRLDVSEVLIIKRAPSTARHRRVYLWRTKP